MAKKKSDVFDSQLDKDKAALLGWWLEQKLLTQLKEVNETAILTMEPGEQLADVCEETLVRDLDTPDLDAHEAYQTLVTGMDEWERYEEQEKAEKK